MTTATVNTVNTVNTATLPERIEHKMVGPAHVTVHTPASVYTDAPARANVHVAGVTFDNRQNKLAYINRMATKYHAWWRVVLRREPKNQADPNAIAVHVVLITKTPDKSGKKQHWIKVGYLPKAYARLVHDINDIVVDNATINPWRDFKTGKLSYSMKLHCINTTLNDQN